MSTAKRFKKVRSMEEAFWMRVPDRPDEGCWEWQGGRLMSGYGVFSFNKRGIRKSATHVSVYLTTGMWPSSDMVVAHKCDNPCCVRPDHLLVATQKWNVDDAINKERMPTGSKKSTAKLTAEQVAEILKLKGIETTRSAGKKFGVNFAVIGRIWRGTHYKKEIQSCGL